MCSKETDASSIGIMGIKYKHALSTAQRFSFILQILLLKVFHEYQNTISSHFCFPLLNLDTLEELISFLTSQLSSKLAMNYSHVLQRCSTGRSTAHRTVCWAPKLFAI